MFIDSRNKFGPGIRYFLYILFNDDVRRAYCIMLFSKIRTVGVWEKCMYECMYVVWNARGEGENDKYELFVQLKIYVYIKGQEKMKGRELLPAQRRQMTRGQRKRR